MGLLVGTDIHDKIIHAQEKNGYTFFIETGFQKGLGCIAAFAMGFDNVASIELNKDFLDDIVDLDRSRNIKDNFIHMRYELRDKIREGKLELYHGDSPKTLPGIMKKLNQGCVVYLDAHGHGSPDHTSPLLRELEAIKNSPYENFIIIDDVYFIENHASDIDRAPWAESIKGLENLKNKIHELFGKVKIEKVNYPPKFAKGVKGEYIEYAGSEDGKNYYLTFFTPKKSKIRRKRKK